MYRILVDTLVKIFNEDAYINNTISNVISNNKFTPYEKKIFTKVVYGVVENKLLLAAVAGGTVLLLIIFISE